MQQAVRFSFGKGGGLLAIDDIIRDGGHFGGVFESGDKTFESADAHFGR
jgi:hypothetical protein